MTILVISGALCGLAGVMLGMVIGSFGPTERADKLAQDNFRLRRSLAHMVAASDAVGRAS